MNPKILTIDIENAPMEAYVWSYYETNVVKVIRYSYILMVGFKWAHEKKAKVYTLLSHPGKGKKDDSRVMEAVWKLLDEADIVVTQNGDAFDIKKMNTAFLKMGLPPYSPFKSVDTKKTSKASFYFANNKLDNLGVELGLGGKMQHEGFEMWEKVMNLDPKATKKMADYCARDVELTELIYLAERPWMKNHPNLNIYTDKPQSCPKCLSEKIQSRGERIFKNNTACRMYRCSECKTPLYGERLPQNKVVLS